ncbi:prepilin peptidase-dependent protein [Moellerella wisconsensis]|uniref:prepilin peptidase-dependent protein n=1 Tax=Moellerella wisconsensis TaxID=158849 RepID=UPI0030763BDA
MLNVKPQDTRLLQQGFTLLETLIALSISSLVCLAIVQTYPMFVANISQYFIHYQIDRDAKRVLLNIEKDFRRIGYCLGGKCVGEAITLGAKQGEAQHSCILFAYDQDNSGLWAKPNKQHSNYFAYRLNNHRLESARGADSCNIDMWASLFDPLLINVQRFTLDWQPTSRLLHLNISLVSVRFPTKSFDYQISIFLRNQS